MVIEGFYCKKSTLQHSDSFSSNRSSISEIVHDINHILDDVIHVVEDIEHDNAHCNCWCIKCCFKYLCCYIM